jgi:nitronate monooxygenase
MALPEILRNKLSVPVIASPMFIVSNPKLVMAQCINGIVGSFPALNARPKEQLEDWLKEITEGLAEWEEANPGKKAAPYAVNQIVHRSNERLQGDLELCVKYRVPIIISSLGAREDVNTAVHSYGGIVLHDVIDNNFARKAIEKGADGLIAVAAGAGGHAGKLSPFALLQEIREWFDGPVALSGAIATGRAILAARAAGADLAYIGSAFIATEEANAPPAYRQMIVDSSAEDILYTSQFTGVHGNYLKPSIAAAGLDPASFTEDGMTQMNFASEPKVWKEVWSAGQGSGAVKAIMPAAELITRLVLEYTQAKAELV